MSNNSHSRIRRVWLGSVLGAALIFWVPGTVFASPTEIVRAVFQQQGGGRWHVSVTLKHTDTGWEHYTNRFVVETLDGRQLGKRVLFHPHEHEQPFTRSDTVRIPDGITKVVIRAGDNVGGVEAKALVVDLTKKRGDRYEVR